MNASGSGQVLGGTTCDAIAGFVEPNNSARTYAALVSSDLPGIVGTERCDMRRPKDAETAALFIYFDFFGHGFSPSRCHQENAVDAVA